MNFVFADTQNPGLYGWEDVTVDTENSRIYFGKDYPKEDDAAVTKYVHLVDDNGDEMYFYTVRMNFINGSSETMYVLEGDTVYLPEDVRWTDGTDTYDGGVYVEINDTTTFTAMEADTRLKVTYNINFSVPTGTTVTTIPTIFGTAETSLTDRIENNSNVLVRRVSSTEVKASIDSSNTGNTRVVRFLGWQVQGTDDILNPNSTLTWDELVAYANGGRGIILNGIWESHALHTAKASLFIHFLRA